MQGFVHDVDYLYFSAFGASSQKKRAKLQLFFEICKKKQKNILSPMDFACMHVEDMRLVRSILQDVGEVLAVGVGDEDLSEIGTVDQVDDTLNALTIKLVEDVVEEQDGALVEYAGIAEEERLTELEGQQESLLLPLAAYTLDRVVAERHLEFVLVDTLGCPT